MYIQKFHVTIEKVLWFICVHSMHKERAGFARSLFLLCMNTSDRFALVNVSLLLIKFFSAAVVKCFLTSVANALVGCVGRLHVLVFNSSSPGNKRIFHSGRIASGELPLARHSRTNILMDKCNSSIMMGEGIC